MAFFSGKEADGRQELWRGFQILDHSFFLTSGGAHSFQETSWSNQIKGPPLEEPWAQ